MESIEHIGESLLKRAHSPDTANSIFRDRVRQRPLLLRATSPDLRQNARSKRQHNRLQKKRQARKSKKPKPLSAKHKRALGLYEIPKSQQKFSIYVPLHEMWCGYMREILGLNDLSRTAFVTAASAGPILVSADYHGALIQVVRSRCPSRVGLKGIVVKDTKFTFELCTERNEIKLCPKEHTVFAFEIPLEVKAESAGEEATSGEGVRVEYVKEASKPLRFEIHGNQFQSRAPDRASKKVRMHFDADL